MAEVELKFDLSPGAHAAFRRLAAFGPARARTTRLHAIYFDTPGFELRERQMALRLRRDGRRWVQTLKAGRSGAGGLHARDEWEADRPDASLDLALLAGTPLEAHAGLAERLAEVFTVDMRRTSWEVVVSPGNRVEVALDRGEVRHGERAEPISEVEIESLEGDPLAVFDLAERLLPQAGVAGESPALHPSAVTKAQRGYRLAGGDVAAPARAVPADLHAGLSPGQAARRIAAAALEQLQANEPGVIAGEDPEYLHQFRVAARRLRSAIGVFRAEAGPAGAALREELRWLSGLTGPARDWDVFVSSALPELLEAHADPRSARAVRARAEARRREAGRTLRDALRSPRYARLLLAVARWLAEPAPDPGPGEETLVEFALRVVARRHKRLLRDARRLSASTPAERHALRLDAKRLRYALEGLAPLFRRRRVATHLEALSEIQDDLGRANDAAVAARLLAELRPAAPLAAFARGWFAAQAQAGAEGLGRHARRLESVRRLKPAAG